MCNCCGENLVNSVVVGGVNFSLPRRYRNLNPIGRGSYGVVCKAFDAAKSTNVAVKKVCSISETMRDSVHFLREIRIMRTLRMHENIVSLMDVYLSSEENAACLIMGLSDFDLLDYIASTDLENIPTQSFMYQLIDAVSFIHKSGFVHRDLKPENILISRDLKLQVADFGQARICHTGEESDDLLNMTEHAVTRWYRPPELMLRPNKNYDFAVDMWSIGCIFAEMLGGKPLFPGSSFVHQLSLIIDVIGAPSETEVSHIKGTKAKRFLDSVRGKEAVDLRHIFPDSSDSALDLLKNLLMFNPSDRITAVNAFQHDYIKSQKHLFQTTDDVKPLLQLSDFSFEYENMKKSEILDLIMADISFFRKTMEPPLLQDQLLDNTQVDICLLGMKNLSTNGTVSYNMSETDRLGTFERHEICAFCQYNNQDIEGNEFSHQTDKLTTQIKWYKRVQLALGRKFSSKKIHENVASADQMSKPVSQLITTSLLPLIQDDHSYQDQKSRTSDAVPIKKRHRPKLSSILFRNILPHCL